MSASFAADWPIVRILGRQQYLLISLVAFLALLPVLSDAPLSRLIINGLLTLIVITGPASLARHRRAFLAAVALALLTWSTGWVAAVNDLPLWGLIAALSGAAFFGYLCILLFSRHLLFERKVSQETLLAAVNAYLALGLMFAFFFIACEVINPGAFSGEFLEASSRGKFQGFVYFSFVTLTTLGYGDMAPKHPVSAMLTYMEALVGQMYVALTVARIVGIYVAQAAQRGKRDS